MGTHELLVVARAERDEDAGLGTGRAPLLGRDAANEALSHASEAVLVGLAGRGRWEEGEVEEDRATDEKSRVTRGARAGRRCGAARARGL